MSFHSFVRLNQNQGQHETNKDFWRRVTSQRSLLVPPLFAKLQRKEMEFQPFLFIQSSSAGLTRTTRDNKRLRL